MYGTRQPLETDRKDVTIIRSAEIRGPVLSKVGLARRREAAKYAAKLRADRA